MDYFPAGVPWVGGFGVADVGDTAIF